MTCKYALILPLCLAAALAQADDRNWHAAGKHDTAKNGRENSAPWGGYGHVQLLTKKWDDLSQDEKKRVREAKERYRNLPEDRQERLREKWEKMPKKERDKYKLERRNQ